MSVSCMCWESPPRCGWIGPIQAAFIHPAPDVLVFPEFREAAAVKIAGT